MHSRSARILFIITQSELGGAQRHLLMLATRLRDNGVTPVVVCGSDGALTDALREESIDVHVNPHLVRPIRPWTDLRAIASLVAFIRAGNFDIVHCHSTKAGIVGRIAARIAGARIVLFTVHGCVLNEPLSRPGFVMSWALEWFTGILSTRVIAVSALDRDTLVKFRTVAEDKIAVIRNGIEPVASSGALSASKADIRDALNVPRDAYVVGTTANFYRTKALDVLIRAAANVVAAEPQVRFVLVGDGMERPVLEELIATHGLERNVILVGQHPQARELLPAFDQFVLSSRKEGLPLALLEAMAAGLPVVATNVGGMPEVVEHQRTGLVVPPEDPDALAEAIVSIVRDPDKQRQYGEAGRDRVRSHFTIDGMFAQTLELYRREAERAYGQGVLTPALGISTTAQ